MAFIKTENPAPGVVLLTLDRPEARNALSIALRQELTDALAACRDDDAVRCVVIAGGEKVFASGADLKELASRRPNSPVWLEVDKHWKAWAAFPKPMIAAVRGVAFGGGFELALHADIILAGQSARFSLPEIKLGLLPGGGGSQRLVRAVGKYTAMRYLLTGDVMSADTARDLGVVAEVLPDDQVIATAVDMAGRIAANAPLAARQIKDIVLTGADAQLEVGLSLERKAVLILSGSEDMQEGVAAFFEKRQPQFQGK